MYTAVGAFVVTMATWPKNDWKINKDESFQWKQYSQQLNWCWHWFSCFDYCFHWKLFLVSSENGFYKCQESFMRIFIQHKNVFLCNGKILLIKKGRHPPHIYWWKTSGRYPMIFLLLSLYFKQKKKNDWVKRRKICMRQAVMKRHCK